MTGLPVTDEAIQVVAAVVERDGRYLLCQRHGGPHLPFLWEFPGGKVEADETAPVALVREIQEELGVTCDVGAEIADITHRYPEKTVRIRFFRATLEGEPQAIIHRALSWIAPADFHRHEAPPPNAKVLALLAGRDVQWRAGELETH